VQVTSLAVFPHGFQENLALSIYRYCGGRVLEFLAEGTTTDGMKHRMPEILAFHFRNGKIEQVHDYYDRLLIVQQLAKGWLAKRIVSYVVNRTEEGLH